MEANELKDLLSFLGEMEQEIYMFDGFNDAIVGYAEDGSTTRLVYNEEKFIEILAKNCSKEDALDNFYYNYKHVLTEEGGIGYISPIFMSTSY